MTQCQRPPARVRRDIDAYIPQHQNIGQGKKRTTVQVWGENNKTLILSLTERSAHCGHVRGFEGNSYFSRRSNDRMSYYITYHALGNFD